MRAIAWKIGREFTTWHLRDGDLTLCGIVLSTLRTQEVSQVESHQVSAAVCKNCLAARRRMSGLAVVK